MSTSACTVATRHEPHADGALWLPPGGYGRDADGWAVKPPEGPAVRLYPHEVVEHANGTISFSRMCRSLPWRLERGRWIPATADS